MIKLHTSAVRVLLSAFTVLLFSACASMFKNTVDVADDAHFGEFKTYAWITDESLLGSRTGADEFASPINDRRVRSAVEQELEQKGYQKVSRNEADFIVSYTLRTRDRVRVHQFYDDFGYRYYGFYRGFSRFGYSGFGRYGNRTIVQTFTEGNLVVDIFDNRSKKAIWHGVASKRLTGQDKNNVEQLINDATASVLTEFPDKEVMPKVMTEVMG